MRQEVASDGATPRQHFNPHDLVTVVEALGPGVPEGFGVLTTRAQPRPRTEPMEDHDGTDC